MTAITVVDTLEVTGDQIAEAIDLWDRFETFTSSQPGFISGRLVQAHDSGSKFNIVIISEWESKEAFDAATSGAAHANVGSPQVAFPRHRASYYTVREVASGNS